MQTKKRRRLKKKAIAWLSLFLIFLIVFIVSLVKLIMWFKDNKETNNIIDEINEIVDIEQVNDSEEELLSQDEKKDSDYWYYIKQPFISVDINKLKEKNNDTVGWINVNNTNINYPFVQTNNNDYYLNHAFDKSNNSAGWVFLDFRNDKNLAGKNNILYAHARKDNSMFGSLRSVIKNDWYSNKDNHIIRLSTETENTMWQIFSVYRTKIESYYITTEFPTDKAYEEFLNTIKERSLYNFNTSISTNDRILTLSTCNGEDYRIVVHAKLIKRSFKKNT